MPVRNNMLAGNILPSSGFNPAVFQGNTFTPQQADMSLLARSLDKIEQRELATSQQRGAIAKALADVELNEAEDAWKADYANRIQDEINGLISFGDYSNALNRSAVLAGKALADPALRGRVRAQQEYKKKRDEVLARTDLNQVTKDRWLEQNPYHYEDKFDANGNIVGGTKWESDWNPVSRYDMTKLYGLVQQLAAKEAGGGESAMFMREDGSLTSRPEEGFYGMAVKRGGKWERLPVEKLRNVFNALFKQAPEAMDSLLQDMDDRRWQYDKATEEEKKNFIGSDIIRDDGTFRSPEEYLMHRANPVLSEMAYSHNWSTVDYGNAYATRAKAIKDAQTKQTLLGLQELQNNSTMTVPIEVDLKERAGRTFSSIGNALETIKNTFGDIPVYNNPFYKKLLENGDYRGLANYIGKFRGHLGNDKKKQADLNAAMTLLREEGDNFNAYTKGLDEDDIKAVKTYAAVTAGIPMQDAKTNEYTRKIASLKNYLFSYSNPDGKRTNTENFILVFDGNNKQSEFFANLKMTPEEAKKSGITLTTVENKPAIVVNKNCSILTNIADANESLKKDSWFDNKPSYIAHMKPDGSITYDNVMNAKNSSALNALSSRSTVMNNLNNKVDNIFAKSVVLNSITPLQVKPFDDYNTQMLNKLWASGAIEDDDYKETKKEFEANNLKALGAALEHPSNYTFYGRKDREGNAVKLTESEAKEMAKNILIAADQGLIDISPTDAPTGKGYGTVVRIKNKNSKNEVIESDVVYIDGLFDGPASKAVASNPELLSQHSFKQARAIRSSVNDVTGSQINYDAPGAYEKFIASKTLDNVYANIDERRANGKTITEAEAENVATKLLIMSGFNQNSDDFKAKRNTLKSKILTY